MMLLESDADPNTTWMMVSPARFASTELGATGVGGGKRRNGFASPHSTLPPSFRMLGNGRFTNTRLYTLEARRLRSLGLLSD